MALLSQALFGVTFVLMVLVFLGLHRFSFTMLESLHVAWLLPTAVFLLSGFTDGASMYWHHQCIVLSCMLLWVGCRHLPAVVVHVPKAVDVAQLSLLVLFVGIGLFFTAFLTMPLEPNALFLPSFIASWALLLVGRGVAQWFQGNTQRLTEFLLRGQRMPSVEMPKQVDPLTAHSGSDELQDKCQLQQQAPVPAQESPTLANPLAGSSARYDLIFESATDAIVLLGENSEVIAANREARTWWSHASRDLLGLHHSQLYDPDDFAKTRERLERLLAGIDERPIEVVVQTARQKYLPATVTISRGTENDSSAMAIFRDMSVQKSIRQELQGRETMLQSLALAAVTVLQASTSDGTITSSGLRVLQQGIGALLYVGWDADRAAWVHPQMGQALQKLGYDSDVIVSFFDPLPISPKLYRAVEYEDRLWHDLLIIPIGGDVGLHEVIVFFIDEVAEKDIQVMQDYAAMVQTLLDACATRQVTEQNLREARQQAEASAVLKDQFLATMSHEIRTPMNGIIGMTTLLHDTNLDDRQSELVQLLRTSSSGLLTLLNDILDFSVRGGKNRIRGRHL